MSGDYNYMADLLPAEELDGEALVKVLEFSHSLTAWILGWKSNPLALNYAQPSVVVFHIRTLPRR